MKATIDLDSWHLSRNWAGPDDLPDCDCPRAACGYAIPTKTCPQHSPAAGKTIRNSHPPEECPGEPDARKALLESRLGQAIIRYAEGTGSLSAVQALLTEHEREMKAAAWDEQHECPYVADAMHENYCVNPYRKRTER